MDTQHTAATYFLTDFITILQLLLFTKRALHAKFCFLGEVNETANMQIMSPLHINSPTNIKPPHTQKHTKKTATTINSIKSDSTQKKKKKQKKKRKKRN